LVVDVFVVLVVVEVDEVWPGHFSRGQSPLCSPLHGISTPVPFVPGHDLLPSLS
jgi:hypothetical protein